MERPTTSQLLTLWVEAQMAGGTTKAELAKALKAKGAELEKGAKPVIEKPTETPPETQPAPVAKTGEGDKK